MAINYRQQADAATDTLAHVRSCGSDGRLMPDGGRVIAIISAPGARTGSWQPDVAQGAAMAAMDSLVRYFAVALTPREIP